MAACPEPPAMTDRIAQIAIPVADLDRAATFYAEELGWEELYRAPNFVAYNLDGTYALDGVRALLTERPGYAAPLEPDIVIYLATPDIEQRHADLVDGGAADGGAPRAVAELGDATIWTAFVKDPSGNIIGLIEEREAA